MSIAQRDPFSSLTTGLIPKTVIVRQLEWNVLEWLAWFHLGRLRFPTTKNTFFQWTKSLPYETLFAYLHHDRIKRDHPVVKVYEPSAFRVKLVRNANVRHRRRNRTLTIHDTALTVKIRRRICQREAYSDPRDRLNLTPNPWNNVPISGHLTTGVRDFMEWNGRRRFQMRCKIRVHPGSNFGTNFIKFRDWTWLFCRCLQLLQNDKKN